MTREHRRVVRTATVAVLAVAAASVLLAPTASAQETACEEALETAGNLSAEPGEQLADAIGDQREEIGGTPDDRRFDARLANATSNESRAEIVADEVDRVEDRLAALERCLTDYQSDAETDDAVDASDRSAVDALREQARALHRRLNETERAAERLPVTLREANDVEEERFEELERRIVELRDELARAEPASATPEG